MRTLKTTLIVILTMTVINATVPSDDADKARVALESYLSRVAETRAGRIVPIEEVPADAVSGHRVFSVRFRGYPVKPPDTFKVRNLFVVKTNLEVKRLSDEKTAKQFFADSLPVVKSDATAKSALKMWLRLAEELHQDGYYTFKFTEDSASVILQDGKRVASGVARVSAGGEGQIEATLTFDANGKLINATAGAKIRPTGDRPAGGRLSFLLTAISKDVIPPLEMTVEEMLYRLDGAAS